MTREAWMCLEELISNGASKDASVARCGGHVDTAKMRHAKVQSRLVGLLHPKARHLGVVETEVGLKAFSEYALRGADVAFVSQADGMRSPITTILVRGGAGTIGTGPFAGSDRG